MCLSLNQCNANGPTRLVRHSTGLRTPKPTRESANKLSPGTEENRESYWYRRACGLVGLWGRICAGGVQARDATGLHGVASAIGECRGASNAGTVCVGLVGRNSALALPPTCRDFDSRR